MNKPINQYLHDIKILFPTFEKEEKAYFNRIKETIIKEINDGSYDDCVNKLGTPKDVIMAYYEELDSDILVKKINKRNIIKNVSWCIVTCIIVISLTACFLLYRTYEDIKENHASFVEETIEVIE